jgi:hypothetical protein
MAMTTAEKKDYYTIFHVDTIKEWCLSLGMDMGVPGTAQKSPHRGQRPREP